LSSQKWSIMLEKYVKKLFGLEDRINSISGDTSIKKIKIKVSHGTEKNRKQSISGFV